MSEGSTPIPGWYADPQDPARLRWWDGSQWTSHTQPYSLEAGSAESGTTAAAETPASPGVASGPAAPSAAGPGQSVSSSDASGFAAGVGPTAAVGAAGIAGIAAAQGFGSNPVAPAQPGAAGFAQPAGMAPQPQAGQFGQPGQAGQFGRGQSAAFGPSNGVGAGYAQPGQYPGQQAGQYPGQAYGDAGYNNYGYGYGYDPTGYSTNPSESFAALDEKAMRNKMITAGLIGALAASLLGGLLWLLFGRDSGGNETEIPQSGGTSTGEPMSTSGACQALAQELSRDELPADVAVRLQELATNTNAAANAEFFSTLEVDLAPTRDQYQQQCLADVASGNEPSTYRSFVTSFDRAVSDGATLGSQIAATNTVDPAQARTLTDDATALQQAAAALPASSSSGSTQSGDGNVSAQNDPFATSTADPFATPAPLASSTVDPFASTPVDPFASTPVDPFATTNPDPYASALNSVDPFAAGNVTPTPLATPSATPTTPSDGALAAADNAADQAARSKSGAAAK